MVSPKKTRSHESLSKKVIRKTFELKFEKLAKIRIFNQDVSYLKFSVGNQPPSENVHLYISTKYRKKKIIFDSDVKNFSKKKLT